MAVVENEAQAVAKSFQIDPAKVNSAALAPVPEDKTAAKAHHATYRAITPLDLEPFPASSIEAFGPGETTTAGNKSKGAQQGNGENIHDKPTVGSSGSDTDSS